MKLDLEKIKIENFFSYKNATFDNFKAFNVIIGKNNSGKSNLFKLFSLLKKNTFNNDIKASDIYDENIDLDNRINLIFNIKNELRAEIISILYYGNHLVKMFEYYSNNPNKNKEIQHIPDRNNKKEVIEWLLSNDIFNKLSIDIIYDKKLNFLTIQKISVYHKLYNNFQTLFQIQDENNNKVAFILDLVKFGEISRSLEGLFRLNELKKLPLSTTFSLRTILNFRLDDDTIKRNIRILIPISKSLFDDFFNAIYVIPAKRMFDSDSDRDNLSNTNLDLNGKNLVKFIHKKAAKQEWEWLKDWNQDLKHFLKDIEVLRQDVRGNEKSTLILNENDLNMDIPLESMGSGILNIAHFLAYIKTLENSSILCFEEPELHLHPGLERELRDEFIRKTERHQIFISTHSREFLDDEEEKCSIYLIDKREGCSNVKKISNLDYSEVYKDLALNLAQYEESNKILTDSEFWRKFVLKSMKEEKYETELWDFKEFIEIWKVTDPQVKRKKKIEFCGHIAAFANNKGGVLIIGISDKTPREFNNLDDIEDKMNELDDLIIKILDYPRKFVSIKPIKFSFKESEEKECIIIIIAQTQDIVAVKDDYGTYSYFYRITSGKQLRAPREIKEMKVGISRDNFNFLNYLKEQFQS